MADAPIHVGILTYNGLAHTKRCIASLMEHTCVPWQATILDNASTDETPRYLATLRDERIAVICSSDNRGVSGGRNQLFETMLIGMPDEQLLVFLDNDIEVGAGWAQPFVRAFAARPRLGVAGRWAFSMLVHDAWRDILSEENAHDAPADTVQGCCFWLRAAAARAVGHFDETLGQFWHEDDDYCIRALHAGWDVRRVRCDAIWHHEHGSGVALRPERVAGSLRNQARLAAKWRAMHAIDAHGRPVRPVVDETAALQMHLAARLARTRALTRTEASAAVDDTARLLQGDENEARVAVRATPAVRAMLDDAAMSVPETDVSRNARATARRVNALLAARRGDVSRDGSSVSALPHASPRRDDATASAATSSPRATVGAFSAICNPHAFDDARWMSVFEHAFQDGRSADYYARTETDWRDGQLMFALRRTGALDSASRVLLVGHASERLIGALSHVVRDLVIADDIAAAPGDFTTMSPRAFGDAQLHATTWPVAQAHAFDAVLCPNLSRFAPSSRFAATLKLLSSYARPNGWVGVGVSVRMTGPADGRWVEPATLADDAGLCRAGVRRVGRFDGTIADALLLAAIPAGDEGAHWRPRLARELPPHRVTLATLYGKRVGDA